MQAIHVYDNDKLVQVITSYKKTVNNKTVFLLYLFDINRKKGIKSEFIDSFDNEYDLEKKAKELIFSN